MDGVAGGRSGAGVLLLQARSRCCRAAEVKKLQLKSSGCDIVTAEQGGGGSAVAAVERRRKKGCSSGRWPRDWPSRGGRRCGWGLWLRQKKMQKWLLCRALQGGVGRWQGAGEK